MRTFWNSVVPAAVVCAAAWLPTEQSVAATAIDLMKARIMDCAPRIAAANSVGFDAGDTTGRRVRIPPTQGCARNSAWPSLTMSQPGWVQLERVMGSEPAVPREPRPESGRPASDNDPIQTSPPGRVLRSL